MNQMTQQMQRLIARVDGLPPRIPPALLVDALPPKHAPGSQSPTPTRKRPRRRTRCLRADWMSGRVPSEIERRALTELTDIGLDLAAEGLM